MTGNANATSARRIEVLVKTSNGLKPEFKHAKFVFANQQSTKVKRAISKLTKKHIFNCDFHTLFRYIINVADSTKCDIKTSNAKTIKRLILCCW